MTDAASSGEERLAAFGRARVAGEPLESDDVYDDAASRQRRARAHRRSHRVTSFVVELDEPVDGKEAAALFNALSMVRGVASVTAITQQPGNPLTSGELGCSECDAEKELDRRLESVFAPLRNILLTAVPAPERVPVPLEDRFDAGEPTVHEVRLLLPRTTKGTQTANTLIAEGITTLAQLRGMSDEDLLKIRKIGPGMVALIRRLLEEEESKVAPVEVDTLEEQFSRMFPQSHVGSRTRNALSREGITTLARLRGTSNEALQDIRNLGAKGIALIHEILEEK